MANAWGDRPPNVNAPRIVVMGVSGCGKSRVGRALADALGLEFVEGDELHPPRNVQRMAAGTPLTDEDRLSWLHTLAARLAGAGAPGRGMVVSCSALKRAYRDVLRTGAPDLRFVHLQGDKALIEQRLRLRVGHYMPPSLLQSQLDTLEPPGPDEAAIAINIAEPVERIVDALRRQLLATPA
jgi:carbohydrate kinase (thermoresistant glucokinase family)